ncbi:MAG: desulfoferrodoxin family protein [Planctomycetota bacterium]
MDEKLVTEVATNRRTFLKASGLVAVTVAVPSFVWGCSRAEDVAEAVEVKKKEEWEKRAAALEQPGVHTTSSPGKWEGKAAGHVPQVTFRQGECELFTKHPMSEEHYITAHYLRNQDGIVIGWHDFQGTDPEARHTFTLPKGTTQITAYSHCNQHDHWKSDAAEVA